MSCLEKKEKDTSNIKRWRKESNTGLKQHEGER